MMIAACLFFSCNFIDSLGKLLLMAKFIRQLAFLFFLSFVLFWPHSLFPQNDPLTTARKVIYPEFISSVVNVIASDSLQGRNTPSTGLDKAADFIAEQFKNMGLQPLQQDYFQPLGYCYLDLGRDNTLSVFSHADTITLALKTDFIPYEITGNQNVEASAVFAGYGITAPDYHYDDYKKIDARGKVVVILRQEPGQTDSSQKLFKGLESTPYSILRKKVNMAIQHGAMGVIVLSGPLNYSSLKPKGFPWPSLSKTLPSDALPLIYCDDLEKTIPVVHAGEAMVNMLFGHADSLKRIQQRIDALGQAESFDIPGVKLHLKTSVEPLPLRGKNVAGFLQGRDPKLSSEILVIGAHYDHIGFMKATKEGSDSIFNGADDNASGTAGVIAIARAFSAMKIKPKRSVLFILFAGEELGLLGSSTYVRKPLLPLDATVAMINLDMIGRNHPDSLFIEGARQNPGLMKIIRKENKKTGMTLVGSRSKKMSGGSDHYPFYQKNIPAVFFFTGLHKDYHKVSDNPDRLDAGKNARVARLAFLTAWQIANEKHHYKRNKSIQNDNEN